MAFLCSDEVGALCAESMARMKIKGTSLVANGPSHDALEDLLNAVAAVYGVFPDLWLDQELRYAQHIPLQAQGHR